MPLYEMNDNGSYRVVQPTNAENYDLIQAAERKLVAKTFLKMIKTVDDAIEQAVGIATKNNALAFTKTGILVGHSSIAPHKDLVHFWTHTEAVYPIPQDYIGQITAIEMQRKFAGGMVRWRTSLRPENWLSYKAPSGKLNEITKKEIMVSHYYVSDTFVYQPPVRKRGFTMSDLQNKFARV